MKTISAVVLYSVSVEVQVEDDAHEDDIIEAIYAEGNHKVFPPAVEGPGYFDNSYIINSNMQEINSAVLV